MTRVQNKIPQTNGFINICVNGFNNVFPKAQPYYAKMGLSAKNDTGDGNNKLMERVNYMIHLLEAQQHEKTDNITEEFILYTFLGVFVIFVVDSFAKTGKYTR